MEDAIDPPSGSTGSSLVIIVILLELLLMVVFLLHTLTHLVTVDTTSVALLVLIILVALVPFASEISFPGGGGIQFKQALQAAATLAKDVVPPAETAEGVEPTKGVGGPTTQTYIVTDKKQLKIPAPGYRWKSLLDEDPNLALASLRMEIERLSRALAEDQGLTDTRGWVSAMGTLENLGAAGVLNADEWGLLRSVVRLCNSAVHMKKLTAHDIDTATSLGTTSMRILAAKLHGPPDKRK